MTLIRLAYASQLMPDVGEHDIRQIVSASVHWNRRNAITGCLSVEDGHVVQILEGPEREVTALFERIKRDPRHQGVVEFHREPILRAMFKDWGMRRWSVAEVAAALAA